MSTEADAIMLIDRLLEAAGRHQDPSQRLSSKVIKCHFYAGRFIFKGIFRTRGGNEK